MLFYTQYFLSQTVSHSQIEQNTFFIRNCFLDQSALIFVFKFHIIIWALPLCPSSYPCFSQLSIFYLVQIFSVIDFNISSWMMPEGSFKKNKTDLANHTNITEMQPKSYLNHFVRPNSQSFAVPMATSVEWVEHDPAHSPQPAPREMSEQDYFRLRYETIEQLLTEQNLNLKQQVSFLTQQTRKSLKRQKIQQEDLKQLQRQYKHTVKQLKQATEENMEIKEYVQKKILSLLTAMKQVQLESIINDIKQVVKELCQFFSFNSDPKLHRRDSLQTEYVKTSQDLKEHRVRVDQLSDKFESLLYEYKSSSKPELRKQCILIAKEIKELKQYLPSKTENQQPNDLQKKMSRKYSRDNLKASKASRQNQTVSDQLQFIPQIQGKNSQHIYHDEQYMIRPTPKRRMNQSKSTSYLTYIRASKEQ